MNYDEIQSLLAPLTPRGAEPELRTRVLAAVAEELQTPQRGLWPRAALAVAAAIVVALGLNLWLDHRAEQRLAELFGPPPASKRATEVARMVAEAAGAPAGRWVYERLTARPNTSSDPAKYYAVLQRIVEETQIGFKESGHEALEENRPVDRRGPRRPGGDTSDRQRLVRGELRLTA
ncbi:MAG: hypothetical protein ABFD16_26420 [Thermoguttaceae bacterium]